MYSKILTKLISEAITPFLGFLFIKILVTIFTAQSLGISTNLYNVFNLTVSQQSYTSINTNVLFGFIIFSFLGLSYSLIKSIYFHGTHIKPKLSLSIFNFRVGFLIQDTFHLFSQNLIWLVFNYVSLFLAIFLYGYGFIQCRDCWLNLSMRCISSLNPICFNFLIGLERYQDSRNSICK